MSWTGRGWGGGVGCRLCSRRKWESTKEEEAPESTKARAEMGWRPGVRMNMVRIRWQGVGWGEGRVAPKQTPPRRKRVVRFLAEGG